MSEFVNSLYRGFINLPVGVSVTLIVASLTALTVAIVLWTGRRDPDLRSNDNVSTAAIRLVGGAFIFVSAFSTSSCGRSQRTLLSRRAANSGPLQA